MTNLVILYNKGLSSKGALTAATSQLKDAESKYKAALIDYDNSYLKAPFDGIVDQIYVDEGELVSQNSNISLCSFIAINPIIAVLNVAEQDIGQVNKKAEVYINSLDGVLYPGKVNFISKIADSATLSFKMEVSVVNKDYKLLPGQSIHAVIKTDKMLAHKLPLSAVSLDDKGVLAIKVLDGENTVVAKPIEIID
ncbi:MAG: efflux RND transporter periplasmic adaptor subunit, partial [Pseudanabaena sp.]